MIIVGTRPEVIRLSTVIKKCRQYFDTIVVHTGQNYDYNLNGIFFRDLGLAAPEIFLNAAGANLGETMGNIIAKSYEVMEQLRPDAVLVLGDTKSCLFHYYNCLQMNAFCVVSDSGTLPEENSFFTSIGHSFPAVCIKTSTERPEALDKGCFIISGIDTNGLLQSVDLAVEIVKNEVNGGAVPVPDYTDLNVSDKVVKIIQSYTNIVNRMVWRKEKP